MLNLLDCLEVFLTITTVNLLSRVFCYFCQKHDLLLNQALMICLVQYRSKVSYHPLARRDSRLAIRDSRLAIRDSRLAIRDSRLERRETRLARG